MILYRLSLLLATIVLSGCSNKIWGLGKSSNTNDIVDKITPASESLTVLSAVGGLCLLAGMVLLIISRGTLGWRPCIGGIILVLLNYMVAEYAHWIFIPVLLATGCISAVWGWKTIEGILNKEKCNE